MDMFKKLINELLTNPDDFESQSFKINENGELEFGSRDIAIVIYCDEYVIQYETHDFCDSAHVSCLTMVEKTSDAYEALEMATLAGRN